MAKIIYVLLVITCGGGSPCRVERVGWFEKYEQCIEQGNALLAGFQQRWGANFVFNTACVAANGTAKP